MSVEQFITKLDMKISNRLLALIAKCDWCFFKKNEYVPKIDPDTNLIKILHRNSCGFSFNKRVLIQGYHGTGKSTHIGYAARLNWPCVRVNLDSHISRIDLIVKMRLF